MAQSGPATIQEIDDLKVQWDYDSATRRYLGHASPGSANSDNVWRIRRLTFDASGRHTLTEFADGDAEFNNIWDNRKTTITYS